MKRSPVCIFQQAARSCENFILKSQQFLLYYKRLEEGAFRVPKLDTGGVQLDAAELGLILECIDLARATRQKRFSTAG